MYEDGFCVTLAIAYYVDESVSIQVYEKGVFWIANLSNCDPWPWLAHIGLARMDVHSNLTSFFPRSRYV